MKDLLRAIVDDRPPSELTYDLGLFEVRRYIGRSALIGAVLGGLAGGSGRDTNLVPARHDGLQHVAHHPQCAALD